MQTYYLILRDDPNGFQTLSPSEMQAVVQRYVRWRQDQAKHVTAGQKLVDGQGRVMRRSGGVLKVSDGPFVESKEVLGGFFAISAPSFEAAQEIASTCPHLEFGSIEVRMMEPTGDSN